MFTRLLQTPSREIAKHMRRQEQERDEEGDEYRVTYDYAHQKHTERANAKANLPPKSRRSTRDRITYNYDHSQTASQSLEGEGDRRLRGESRLRVAAASNVHGAVMSDDRSCKQDPELEDDDKEDIKR